jgi:hypothetical protein
MARGYPATSDSFINHHEHGAFLQFYGGVKPRALRRMFPGPAGGNGEGAGAVPVAAPGVKLLVRRQGSDSGRARESCGAREIEEEKGEDGRKGSSQTSERIEDLES